MAKIYGKIDSLEQLQTYLKQAGIDFLSSLDEITSFKQNYEPKIAEKEAKIKAETDIEIAKEKVNIVALNKDYDNKLEKRGELLIKERSIASKKIDAISKKPKNVFSSIFYFFKLYSLKIRITILTKHFEKEKKRLLVSLKKVITGKIKSLEYIGNNYDLVVSKKLNSETSTLKKAKEVLDEYNSLFLGAIGEQKAVNELEKLPDTYTIVNNFQLELDKPIYNKNIGQRIHSIQADHIVIGPSGVFLIETKNWSQDSINNLDLYSPVEQVKRSSFGLFCYLNNSVNSGRLSLFKDHWGDRKISIRNIIIMAGAKPNKEFQYVKVLGLSKVCGYIKYFKPVFSEKEIKQVLDYLIE